MWFHRSKVLWAQNGDKNSKLFHIRVTQRKRKNLIQKIRDDTGTWTLDLESISQCLINYYQDLFTLANLQQHDVATNSINNFISEEMNAQLTAEFKVWEIQ